MNPLTTMLMALLATGCTEQLTGIDVPEPGHKKIRIQPQADKAFSFASASFDSPYGLISSGWDKKNNEISVKVTVPCYTTTEIIIPGVVKTVGS